MIDSSPQERSAALPYDVKRMSTSTTLNKPHAQLSIFDRIVIRIPESNLVTLCGGMAGAASAVVSCPLDVIKTKLQAQGGFRGRSKESSSGRSAVYRGIRGTARTIWTEEGLRGLYRGLGPLLLGYIPTWAVYLTVYNKSQVYFNSKTGRL
jgi:solute carrier family 25 (mitochondrial folate transporter), member 32